MSQFDQYSVGKYVEKLRLFINKDVKLPEGHTGMEDESGKDMIKPMQQSISNLEELVNIKAERAEADDSHIGERLKIARDYKGWSHADIGVAIGVDTEVVRQWEERRQVPSDIIATLACLLDVPKAWLEFGGEVHLPVDSHIGVRVGNESFMYREILYAKTLEFVSTIPEEFDSDAAQSVFEEKWETDPKFAITARRAGGYWNVVSGTLVFVPWIPVEQPYRCAERWSAEVEAIVAEELSAKTSSVYGSWSSIKARCQSMGLLKDKFPTLISLHKRLEKKRKS